MTEGRTHPNPSRPYPILKLKADLILWSYVTQTGMIIMLSVSSGTARFCSFLTLLYSAVSGSCPDLLFPLTNLPQQLSQPVLLQCKYSALPFLHPAPETICLSFQPGQVLHHACLGFPSLMHFSLPKQTEYLSCCLGAPPSYFPYPAADHCLPLVCTIIGILIFTWVFEFIKFLHWNFFPCFP